MIRFLIGLGLIFVVLPARAEDRPSFDCGKASTEIEKAICASPVLSTADRVMVGAYRAVLARAPKEARDLLRVDQRRWIAHISDICQAQWSKDSFGDNYRADCLAKAMRSQAEFYQKSALIVLPSPYGYLLTRQSYRSLPVEKEELAEFFPAVRIQENRYHQFLSPRLAKLSFPTPTSIDDQAYEEKIYFDYKIIGKYLISFHYTKYNHLGGMRALIDSEFSTIDLKDARKLTPKDIFISQKPWKLTLRRKISAKINDILKDEIGVNPERVDGWSDESLNNPSKWALSEGSFGIYFEHYDLLPHHGEPTLLKVPFNELSNYFTPEFKKLIRQ